MRAEFDNSRFIAVDKFFGNATERTTEKKKLTESSTADIKGRRREGVGVKNKNCNASLNKQKPSLVARQVLNVGRKRSRDSSAEVTAKECDDDDIGIHGSHDTYEMTDGRTFLETNLKNRIENKFETLKQKKKLGKKERGRQQHEVHVEADGNKEYQRNNEILITEANKVDGTMRTGPSNKGKQKRRKVRSRQKNIRKDNRPIDKKPSHLIPGSRKYTGRPMTQATREKLSLAKHDDRRKSNTFAKNSSSSFLIEYGQDCSGDVGVKLAIDEYLTGIEIANSDKSTPFKEERNIKRTMRQKSNSSKKRKKKFKNLV